MNKPVKPDIGKTSRVAEPAATPKNGGATFDPLLSPEAIDALADVAKRSNTLFRRNAARLKTDDGYRVIDPRTVMKTFQDFARCAAANPAPLVREQFALCTNLALLWQRAAMGALLGLMFMGAIGNARWAGASPACRWAVCATKPRSADTAVRTSGPFPAA